ncbi:MAG: DEAD/DEAH box helicase family protein [Thermoguttaceae bacterium]
MRFKFDANQDYQVEAIEAVADLFQGQARAAGAMRFELGAQSGLAAIPNRLDLDAAAILSNLQAVQARSRIAPDGDLEFIEETSETVSGNKVVSFANFSVEMETGTGKTYVYVRTIFELFRRYGMRKFIIVVPSVAIREGVLKTLQVTEDHFRGLYGNTVCRYYVYDSANLTQVRQFALSDSIEIMVMTIDSFNKAANVIRQSTDRLQGETPIHLVQAARPILILDEPQNMESEKRVVALALLNPLFALRYSATHRNPYNIVNRLTPAEAYRQGLVKKIEVDSVVATDDENRPYVCVEDIQVQKNKITARLRVHKLLKTGPVKETTVTVRPGESLQEKTGRREYAGYEIDEINPGGKFIRFANEVELRKGEECGADKDVIFEVQIRHTIDEHFRKQARLRAQGIKVLSLFFIDHVDNYARDDGLIRRLFNRAFDELKQKYADWRDCPAASVQAAYFAQKRRKGGEVELLDSSESGDKKEDQAAYDLIMRDKEALLSFPAPEDDEETRAKKQVAFIFSHSALREGWDNPNVFQICTLNQTGSITKKRQEVGRGVRLAVDQSGDRVHDEQVNVLTVVANESYGRYVETYQSEIAFEYRSEIEARYGKPIGDLSDDERRKIEEEYGEGILPPPPREARQRKAKLRKARRLMDEFKPLWERIKHKTRYAVAIDTEKLLQQVIPEIERADVAPPRVTITKARVTVADEDIFEAMQMSSAKTAADLVGRYPLPNLVDVMANLMENTTPPVRVTRKTLLELFHRIGKPKAAVENPHEWASVVVRIVKEALANLLVEGIQYERTGGWYEMSQILDADEIELFSKYVVLADGDPEKALYDLIPCDSEVERRFVKELEARDDVKLYLKLPHWFTVPTPVGNYQPDWAIVLQDAGADGKPVLYLVSETKASISKEDMRPDEWRKIQCGAAHFGSKQFHKKGALHEVDYKLVTSAEEIP